MAPRNRLTANTVAEAPRTGLEGPSRGANEATNWTILRDVKLRFPPQDEVVGFGAIPKLHPGSYESFPFA